MELREEWFVCLTRKVTRVLELRVLELRVATVDFVQADLAVRCREVCLNSSKNRILEACGVLRSFEPAKRICSWSCNSPADFQARLALFTADGFSRPPRRGGGGRGDFFLHPVLGAHAREHHRSGFCATTLDNIRVSRSALPHGCDPNPKPLLNLCA